jgi:hypothetical protein
MTCGNARLSLLMDAKISFAPSEDILILYLCSPRDPRLLGDETAAGMTKSGVAAAQRLSSEAVEGVGDLARFGDPFLEFLGECQVLFLPGHGP